MPEGPSSRAALAATLAFLLALSFFAAEYAAAQTTGRICGRVTESETGRPLEGARVRLRRSTGPACAWSALFEAG